MKLIRTLAILALAVSPLGCGAQDGVTPRNTETAAVEQASATQLPVLLVHKTPWCGCCTAWAEQAETAGFTVELRDHQDLARIKQALGVPMSQASCHTAEIEGYFVEGHVPFEDLHRLLAERPDALGIAVPGMPLGSPGMEADVRHGFSTNLVNEDGSVVEYANHPGDEAPHRGSLPSR